MSIDMNTQLIDVALLYLFLTLNIFCFFIVRTPPHLFKGGGIKFDYLPRKEEGTWKIKKKE